ncbi:O-methyltransferase [Polaribacter sp.]|uniref:O-methyltransferase n=1 Tax=Polaribacter sp. TaxID=1920175 RepID=UPI003F6CB170
MFYQQRKFLSFLSKSANQHGVHSPFVFNLVTKGLYRKTNSKKWKSFKKIKRQLLDNKSFIKVTDFGAGSKIFKSNTRQISKISKIAGVSNKKARILIKIIDYFKPLNILEIGTSLGLGTSVLKLGYSKSNITTLEGCKETANVAEKLFNDNNFKQIELIKGNFSETFIETIKKKTYDCIIFDGNHTKKATLDYFHSCLSTIHNNSFFIFDDIYWNAEMESAWNEIKNNPKVTVTVDLFYYGIVFFRKEQAKEHFKIRV